MRSLAHNTSGYEYRARKVMFDGLIFSLLKYCSSVFYHRLSLKTMRRHISVVQRRCNIITARAYSDIPAETAGLLAKDPPLHLKIIERSVRWLLEHEHPVPYWGHLTPVEIDADGEAHMRDQLSTPADIRREWNKNTLEAWEKM